MKPSFVVHSGTSLNFDFAMDDVQRLLKMHDDEAKQKKGRSPRQAEVYKRAAVILCVTAWESFIEDTIRNAATKRITGAGRPADVQSTFNEAARAWLESCPKPPDLASWAGEGWRPLLLKRLDEDITSLNTPSSDNIRKLSKRYLATDITEQWRWQHTSAAMARERLNHLVTLRGGLVHRGPEFFKQSAVKRKHVVDSISLLRKLVSRTEKTLDVGPRIVAAR